MSIIPGPVPAYSNVPIEPTWFQPRRWLISNVTLNGSTTTITTSADHDLVLGQLVRLLVPKFYGSYQLNEKQGYVTSIPTTTSVIVNIPSYNVNTFITSPNYAPTAAQILPIGDVNSGRLNASGPSSVATFIEGSFINISPN